MSHDDETDETEESTESKRAGVRDVAQRDLDMAGFRILNAKGAPGNGGGGGGGGGEGAPGPIVVDDASMQSLQNANGLIWQQAVDVSEMPEELTCTLSAIVLATGGRGKVELKVGGDVDQTDGKTVASFDSRNSEGELKSASGDFTRSDDEDVLLLKVVADAPNQTKMRIWGKSISVRGAG
jgi:hypothetical protein